MTSADNTGLGLFDDTASAVGNFPSALRGYDRNAVDDYVRSLEGALVGVRRRSAELEHQLATMSEQLEDARQAASEIDYTNLGGRASDILRLAEEQARETLDRANIDAERVREEARREADDTRRNAAREGDDLKSGGLAEIAEVRNRMEEDGRVLSERTQAEADALVAAARRQAESLRLEAQNESQTLRQQAYLETEELRRGAEREAADLRQQVAVEREQAIAELCRMQTEAAERTAALLAEATQHNDASAQRLELDVNDAARIRAEALAEAEKTKLAAIKESEERIQAAKAQAAAITERTQSEFAWRKQELRRETDLLSQRKQAVLNQLASLSALAQQTAQSFPEIDDLTDFDAEQGDRTVLRPAQASPALPAADDPHEQTNGHAISDSGESKTSDATASDPTEIDDDHTTERSLQPGSEPAEEPEMDGDATVVIPAGNVPAGPPRPSDADQQRG
jgi:DivIVA protein